jgi:hypothetical protein
MDDGEKDGRDSFHEKLRIEYLFISFYFFIGAWWRDLKPDADLFGMASAKQNNITNWMSKHAINPPFAALSSSGRIDNTILHSHNINVSKFP